jgi:phosphoglycolate phosphatase-like HAD superfamily hydrolase
MSSGSTSPAQDSRSPHANWRHVQAAPFFLSLSPLPGRNGRCACSGDEAEGFMTRQIAMSVFSLYCGLLWMTGSFGRLRAFTTPVQAPDETTIGQRGSAEPLPSWQDGRVKHAILAFVRRVADRQSPDYVPASERIAVFDNDGTLWTEQPLYVQAMFAMARAKELAGRDPSLMANPLFKAIIGNDRAAMAKFGEQEFGEIVAATHSGMTPEEFTAIVQRWLASARHPRFNRLFTECVYVPMLELLTYLRASGFKTFVVSGGGVDFVRTFSQDVYGIPPEQVIGSSGRLRFELRDGKAVLVKLPDLNSLNDHVGKPLNIQLQLGRRPILAFGNSDGDLEMLQHTAAGSGPRLMLLLHHDDANREYIYDRESSVGRLDKALDEATRQGWLLVSMKQDFRRVFAFESVSSLR